MENLGLQRGKDLDRVDNNGHYEPGNLRWATRAENSRNQRRSRLTMDDALWAEQSSPLGRHVTQRYLAKGYPKEAIIGLAFKSVMDKRKNWRGTAARLAALGYTTSSTPDHFTASPSPAA